MQITPLADIENYDNYNDNMRASVRGPRVISRIEAWIDIDKEKENIKDKIKK